MGRSLWQTAKPTDLEGLIGMYDALVSLVADVEEAQAVLDAARKSEHEAALQEAVGKLERKLHVSQERIVADVKATLKVRAKARKDAVSQA